MAPRQQPSPLVTSGAELPKGLDLDLVRWNRIEDIVNACRELKPQDADDSCVCSAGEPLTAEVESLLNLMRAAKFPLPHLTRLREPERENLTGRVSAIISSSCTAGMGAVYKAIGGGDHQFRKQVAIKLIRSVLFQLRAVSAEREILANVASA